MSFFHKFLSVLFFLSLSVNAFAKWNFDHSVQIISNHIQLSSQPSVILPASNREKALLYARWIEKLFAKFNHYTTPPKTPFVMTELPKNLFTLTIQAGDFYFRDFPNRIIVYGMILDTWFHLIHNQKKSVYTALNPPSEIYLKDVLKLYSDFNQDFRPLEFIRYNVRFTLKQIYFISVQELLERPFLYYAPRYTQDIFFKTVVIPETYTFYLYLKKIYSVKRLVKIAKSAYNKQSWQKAVGESVNETEKKYTVQIENIHFKMDKQTNFTKHLNEILNVYHSTTKKTLFSR